MSQSKNFAIENLFFKFKGADNYFFHDLSFSCQVNSLYLLQGCNGTGKSTLLRLLLGRVQPSESLSGCCVFGNKRFNLALAYDRMQLENFMSYVPQDVNLLLSDNLTIYQNIQMARLVRYPSFGFMPKVANQHRLLQQLNIDQHQVVSQLSGGQRQLLAITLALQKTTKILLLDEPTAALDPANTYLVINFIKQLVKTTSITVIIVNHNQEVVNYYSDLKHLRLFIDDISGERVLEVH